MTGDLQPLLGRIMTYANAQEVRQLPHIFVQVPVGFMLLVSASFVVAVPKFNRMFADMNASLPFVSQIVLDFGRMPLAVFALPVLLTCLMLYCKTRGSRLAFVVAVASLTHSAVTLVFAALGLFLPLIH